MKKTLYKARFHLFISGLCSLLFGITVYAFPSLQLSSLLWLFAGYMFLKGLSLSAGAWLNRNEDSRWLFLLSYGILNIITGLVSSLYPGITLLLLGFIVSVNLVIGGILQIIMAIHLHREIKETGWLVFSGIITTIGGAYIYIIPRIEPLTTMYFIATAAVVISLFLICLSLRANHWPSPKQTAMTS